MLASARPSLGTARPSGPVRTISRHMAAKPDLKVFFGPFNVTQQVSLHPRSHPQTPRHNLILTSPRLRSSSRRRTPSRSSTSSPSSPATSSCAPSPATSA